jgi:hypothetical protein
MSASSFLKARLACGAGGAKGKTPGRGRARADAKSAAHAIDAAPAIA